ncbi:MAG: DUF3486 family protein [Desulfovibrionaceae bacterium]|nr:DUF3486 family protein [Desulfovibrionaceae bacterium]
MTRKSSIRTKLPPEILRELDKKLMQGALTLDALLAFIRGRVNDPPSRSALGRYAASFNETARAMRENREYARQLAQELGPESLEGDQGRLLVEILRGLVFTAMQKRATDPDATFDAAEVAKIARSLKDLSHAMHLEQDFAKRIKDETRKEVEAEMRSRVEALGGAKELKGLSDAELEKKIADLTARVA